MKKNTVKIFSKILLATYLCLLALPVFHYHPICYDASSKLQNAQYPLAQFDPFQNASSECSITQLASTSYINDIAFAQSTDLSNYHFDYKPATESSKPLQAFFVSNGLRAPPTHS